MQFQWMRRTISGLTFVEDVVSRQVIREFTGDLKFHLLNEISSVADRSVVIKELWVETAFFFEEVL